MKRLHIEGTEDSPAILLDPESNTYKFSGESRPENSAAFFSPVLSWLEEFESYLLGRRKEQKATPELCFVFCFEYFNSTSAKYIMDILKRIQSLHRQKFQVVVEWQYVTYDDDMLEAGKEWAKLIDVPFKYVSY